MRRLWTVDELRDEGWSRSALRAAVAGGRWTRVARGVYAEGSVTPTPLDAARAAVLAAGGIAGGTLAGVLHGLDGVDLRGADVTVPPGSSNGVRRRAIPAAHVTTVDGVRCLDRLRTLADLAAELGDLEWEQALECALRRGLVRIGDVAALGDGRFDGVGRVRRVLERRPPGAPLTESLLETPFVQLARTVPGLGPPQRQVVIRDQRGEVIARVDLAWPDLGLFLELDGQQHQDQPVYDARRETAVVAATGWLCGRFTWHEVVRLPRTTARRLDALAGQCRRRAA